MTTQAEQTQNQNSSSILSVTQLTQMIKRQLESGFPSITVEGEISNFKAQSSGHLYFSLKDAGAQISAVMFRGNASKLRSLPKNGDRVMLKGELSVYAPRGNYQLIVKEMQQVGLGELLLKLEELKREVYRRGWFSEDHKKSLPKLPRRIGVVTSPTGAAIRDILKVLSRRFSGFQLVLNPVRVQGVEAAEEIAQAIDQMNEHQLADVLIVGRGGGSIEDLWPFNEEVVAAAIFRSKIPIVAAVGHECDHCIAEYVADVRAPTPTAAAQMVIAEKEHLLEQLSTTQKRLRHTVALMVQNHRQRLQGIMRHPVFISSYALLGPYLQRIDDLRTGLEQAMVHYLKGYRIRLQALQQQANAHNPTTQILQMKQKVGQIERTLTAHMRQKIAQQRQELRRMSGALEREGSAVIQKRSTQLKQIVDMLTALDPRNVLKKGYSILLAEKEQSVIMSTKTLKKDEEIRILLSDGEAKATVSEIFPNT